MAARYCDANENGDENYFANQRQNGDNHFKRRATKFYAGPTAPPQGFVFRPFTRDSLASIRRRKESQANSSKQQATCAYLDPAKPKPQPDPYLASGMQLPPAFNRQLPSELIGKPIEDIDPYYENQETFVIISRGRELTRFSAAKALYLFGPFHPIRRVVLYILVNPLFSLLVILTILTNCILMTIQGNETVEKTEIIFTIIYTTEMGLKVLARGFALDDFTYLRDPWNVLDFTVIIMAYLTIVIQDLGNLSVMRTFRVLRALKTVAIIPGMKTIVGAVIDSVKNLKDVVVLTLFSLSVFSLLGLQIYMGILTQKCISNGPENMTDSQWSEWNSNSSHWITDPESEIYGAYRLCGNATGAQSCPPTHTCLQGFGPNPDYGFTNFDTFGWALICSFRLMTQDFWEGLYMQVLKTAGSWHIIFFIVSIFLGSIYLMNLILAIVAMSYNELQRRAEEEEEAAAEDEAAFLETCKLVDEQISGYSFSTHGAHSSYRPSVEIGLVGQSLLASLCQNGLLGQHVQEKLTRQMVATAGLPSQLPSIRSKSFSVNCVDRGPAAAAASIAPGTSGLGGGARGSKRASMVPACYYHYDTPPTALSMHELRRKSSVRGSQLTNRAGSPTHISAGSRHQSGNMTPPVALAPMERRAHGAAPLAACGSHMLDSPQHASIGTLGAQKCERPLGQQQVPGAGFSRTSGSRRSTRSSTTLDPNLVMLRQRAASIRITDFQAKNPKLVQSLDSPCPSHDKGVHSARNDLNAVVLHDSLDGQWIPKAGPRERRRRRSDNNNQHKRSLKSGDYSATAAGGESGEYYDRIGKYRSEDAICRQPRSINMFRSRDQQATSELVADNNGKDPREDASRQLRASSQIDLATDSTRTPNLMDQDRPCTSQPGSPDRKQRRQLEVTSSPLRGDRMHHLSVENFQQFGATRPSQVPGRLLAATDEPATTGVELDLSSMAPDQRHRSSRGHIHPSTMARSSFARQRPSFVAGHSIGAGKLSARRVSQDFVRRASDWQRLSVSANVDMRRLLRLWSHTNPYQGRTSIGSFSNASQFHYQSSLGSPSRSIYELDKSAAAGFYAGSRSNSPRPSSLGSSRQAYELISAFSRRHNLYPTDARYALPVDASMMDDISVNMRDKCLAYCLSCLDVLCIWECCGFWLKIQRIIAILVFDPFTELFIILCILINTLFMALDSDDADAQMRSIFERGNYFFTATFAVEASMKIMALSPKFYFREGWNVFDTIIVCLSLLELGLEGVYGLSVLRSFRLLRVFKLAKSWPTLNLLISIMGKAVGDLGNLTFVLAIIVFILAVMGMQLFGSKYVAHSFPSGELPRWNFTDFLHSFMIVFRILCAEWIEPMWDCLLVGGWPCIPFFLIAVTVGNLVVLNLFLALLLASFGASNLSSPQADNVDTKKLQEAVARFTRFGRWCRRKVGRFFRALAACLLCRRRRSGGLEAAAAADQGGRFGAGLGGGKAPKEVKSHIAAMSKIERMKNIEMRTEELKTKIRRSPEHHYHLRQLAKSQLRENRAQSAAIEAAASTTSGFNYNYKQRHYSFGSDHSNQAEPIALIPIIVNEAPDRGDSCDSSGGDQPTSNNTSTCQETNEKRSGSLDSSRQEQQVSVENRDVDERGNEETLSAANEKLGSEISVTAPKSQVPEFKHLGWPHPTSMQPIREDSRDADSSASISGSDGSMSSRYASKEQTLKDVPQSSRLEQSGKERDKRVDGIGETHAECYDDDEIEGEVALSERLLRPSTPTTTTSVKPNDQQEEPPHENQEEEEEDRPKSSLYLKAPKLQDMEEEDELALQHIESYIEKCICIGILCLKWFLFRQHVRKIVEHRYFDQCILVLIVVSSGTLALEDKHLDERPNLKRTLDVLDTIFTIIFSLEMIFKWLAFGMKRYFGNIWSWLDFVIVLVSFINLMASIFGSGKIQALKTMRTLRAMRGLRPLRALQRFQGMRVVVNALIQAIPSIFNVLLVCLIFWLIFSIMGVQMFGGKFWRCLSPETGELVTPEEAANKYECIERNLTWSNPQINFDNVPNAYLALFQVATFKGWIDIMNSASDSRMRDDQPIREANIYMYFYFVFFVIFGSFFTLNLFIGVIIDNFNEQKKKTGGSLELFMSDDQKKYYHAMKKMRSKRPVKAMTRPKMKLQAYMFDVTTSKGFDMAIMLIIGLNMFVMALEYYGQSQEYTLVLENLNLVFIAIFTLECLSKIFAMRHFYFREPWNIFDFIVVALSILGVVMKEYVAKYFVSPTLLRVVRVVKVGRVLRLVKGAKGIRTLLFALAMSLPALFNICLLLFLVMFIYAIFGMSFFMNVRPRAGIDETFNFGTFSSSIIVLFQMSTSAGWDLVLDPLMDEENDCQKPDPSQGIEGTCGNKSVAIAYLISYVIITFLIIINMYIAVILENYSQATEDVQEGLTDDDYEMYYEIWQKFDPEGTQLLPYSKLSDFVDALEDPLRIPKPNDLALVVMDINIYQGDQCYCVDILDALTKYFFTRKGLVIQVNEQLQQVQSALHQTPFQRITTTYMIKRENYCAKIIQNCWRKWRERVNAKNEQDLVLPDISDKAKLGCE